MYDLSAPLLAQSWIRIKACRHGFMLYNVNDTQIGKSLETYGEAFEADIQAILPYIKPGDVIVDAGANIGTHALPLARAAGPKGLVLAYEPQSLAVQILNANAALNNLTNIVVQHCALGKRKGQVKIKKNSPKIPFDATQVSLLSPLAEKAPTEQVTITSLDEQSLSKLDFLKIDVEGLEDHVLEGARKTIAHHRPLMFIENNIADRTPAIIQTIWDMGYTLYWFWSHHFNQENFFHQQKDVFKQVDANMFAIPKDSAISPPPSCVLITDPHVSLFDVYSDYIGQNKSKRQN